MLISIPGSPDSFDGNYTELASQSDRGTTWGLAYHRPSGTVFTSAFMKRHVGLGPGSTGAIYAIQGVRSSIFALLPDAGADTHPADAAPLDDWLRDVNSWDAVGRTEIGGIDISDDMNTLWAMNLANRSLYSIEISGSPLLRVRSTPMRCRSIRKTAPNPALIFAHLP